MGIYPGNRSYIVRELTVEQRALGARLMRDRGLVDGWAIDRNDVMVVMAEAMVVPGRIAIAEAQGRAHCRVCGCTEITACRHREGDVEVPCGWADPIRTLCTACAPFLEKLLAKPGEPS